ncbi:MAG TPA: thymidine phosphorylase, partial [Bacteroidota bacterium]|nr:thymidine phosphorylase [Bacteroidota bacterium]
AHAYPVPAVRKEVRAGRSGYLTALATKQIGFLAVALGAGRRKMEDVLDAQAGIILARKVGDKVSSGDVLATIVCGREDLAGMGVQEFSHCVTIGDAPPPQQPCVRAVVDKDGARPWRTPEVY